MGRILGPVQQGAGALVELLGARAAAEPAIALGRALRSLRDGLRSTFQAPHLRPPLFVRGGPIPDQVPSAKGGGASPDRTARIRLLLSTSRFRRSARRSM